MAELLTRNRGCALFGIGAARSVVIVLFAFTALIQTEVFSDDSSEEKRKASAARELPNPFVFRDGRPVRTADDWKERRKEIEEIIVKIEYGGLPPTPSGIEVERLHSSTAKTFSGANFTQYRIVNKDHPSFHFRLDVMTPAEKKGKLPVVLTGDACWKYATDEIVADILKRGYIFAQFSRTAIVPDIYNSDRETGLYKCYPEQKFGAIAAWAWGYHRCVDALLTLGRVDPKAIAIVGHSRGGKTVLLAGATDERIAVLSWTSWNGGCLAKPRPGILTETPSPNCRRDSLGGAQPLDGACVFVAIKPWRTTCLEMLPAGWQARDTWRVPRHLAPVPAR